MDAFGVIERFVERRRAAFGDGAERFFDDVGQATLFIAGRGVVVEAGAFELAEVTLVAGDEAEETIGDGAVAGALDQQVFGAEDFGGFGQDGGGADFGQQVRGVAEGGVGGDAAEGV